MATGSTTHGIPYPLGDELVKDGDNAMAAMATAIDPALARASGIATVSVSGTPGQGSLTVSFPAGRFSATPAVATSSTSVIWQAAVSGTSSTQVTIDVRRWDGGAGTGTLLVHWVAIGV